MRERPAQAYVSSLPLTFRSFVSGKVHYQEKKVHSLEHVEKVADEHTKSLLAAEFLRRDIKDVRNLEE